MIKSIVIPKTVRFSTCIIWRINVNQLDLPPELLFQTVECNEVIPLDEKILTNECRPQPVGCWSTSSSPSTV